MMGAIGANNVLAGGDGEPTLTAKADAMAVRTGTEAVEGLAATKADVGRVRVALEGTRPFALGGDAVLTPSIELGTRYDAGDAETGFGADIGAGLALEAPLRGLSAEVHGRALLAHEAQGLSERALSGTLSFDPTPNSGRGLALSLSQNIGGAATGGADALFGRPAISEIGAGHDAGATERRTEMTLGYGLAAFEGRYTATPELGLALSDAHREVRLGWQLKEMVDRGLAFEVGIEGSRHEATEGESKPVHGLKINLGWRLVSDARGSFEAGIEATRREVGNDQGEGGSSIGLRVQMQW